MLESWTCHCGQSNVGPGACSSCLNAAPPEVRGAVATADGPWRPGRGFVATAIATVVVLLASAVSAFVVSGRDERVSAGRASVEGVGADAAGVEEEAGEGADGGDEPPGGAPAAPDAAGRTVEVSADARPGPDAPELERLLPEMMRFVQEKRGLAFTRPVKVTLLGDAAFRDRIKGAEEEESEEAKEELLTIQRVLEGLGLLEKGIDLEEAVDSLYGDAVAGFYDTEKDDLVVRGEELKASVKVTLVHELTHALQDQHFDIDRKDLDERDDEASSGLTGLVEGDAVRIEELYLATLSNREQKEAEREEAEAASGIDDDIPQVLLQLVAFPYIIGPDFTRAVVRGGGQARLDEAFANPPTTSEQLLHPESFLRREPIATVDTPKADGEKIDEGVLGELGLLLVLNASGESGATAARGWGGDRYVAWRDGKNTCVRTTVAMDSLQDDAELRRALDDLASDRDDFRVEGKGPITFTSCG